MTSRTRAVVSTIGALVLLAGVGIYVRGSDGDAPLTARVSRGTFTVTLVEGGTLRAAESATFRSPLEGRETEVVYLAPEGSEVQPGDLLARLDTTALKTELERATQSVRQIELELQAAEVDREEATVAAQAADGVGALAVDEARTNHWLAQAKANRLKEEHVRLKPLLDKGYITREEFDRSALEVDETTARAALAERALEVLVARTRPAEEQSAKLQLARRRAQIDHLRPKLDAARSYERSLVAAIDACAIRAPRPGLVVHEENLATTPRRKLRIGDRVTAAQGLVTLPDLRHLVIESSVRESDVHLVRTGQKARVRFDAFPDLEMEGRLLRLGTLAQAHGGGEARFAVVFELVGTSGGLRPGMAARVDVIVAEQTDALTVPVAGVFAEGVGYVVYVARGRTVERRVVRAGRSNGVDVEILGGLRENERVFLTEPASRAH